MLAWYIPPFSKNAYPCIIRTKFGCQPNRVLLRISQSQSCAGGAHRVVKRELRKHDHHPPIKLSIICSSILHLLMLLMCCPHEFNYVKVYEERMLTKICVAFASHKILLVYSSTSSLLGLNTVPLHPSEYLMPAWHRSIAGWHWSNTNSGTWCLLDWICHSHHMLSILINYALMRIS